MLHCLCLGCTISELDCISCIACAAFPPHAVCGLDQGQFQQILFRPGGGQSGIILLRMHVCRCNTTSTSESSRQLGVGRKRSATCISPACSSVATKRSCISTTARINQCGRHKLFRAASPGVLQLGLVLRVWFKFDACFARALVMLSTVALLSRSFNMSLKLRKYLRPLHLLSRFFGTANRISACPAQFSPPKYPRTRVLASAMASASQGARVTRQTRTWLHCTAGS
ncbi:hypothetical protein B0J12DRAFT_130346 [Macrophomina phaseolina]|uniref:Secreted protein n=1 Tax=Macrophomina phaseolina TaxID=35725 RepID=A0ABQ8G6I4_9PEZI|nr:hypothetical protein B0J12DRAFT_130346 [Macrophomina phaseolina]